MKQFLPALLVSALLLPAASHAQKKGSPRRDRNEFGVELGGTGVYYNLFYQQNLFRIGDNKTLNLRIGAAVFPLMESLAGSRIGFNVNIMPNILFFSGRHARETGIALGLLDQTRYNVEYQNQTGGVKKVTEVERLLLLGPQGSYRYYLSSNQRIYLRGTVLLHIPLKYWNNGDTQYDGLPVIPWAGVSAGVTL